MHFSKACGLLVLLAACAGSSVGSSRSAGGLALGAKIVGDDVLMKNVDGSMVSIRAAAGRNGTLVIFTCNHCPWSRIWESRIVSLGNRYIAEGIGTIAINPNDPQSYEEDSFVEMQERARAAAMEFPYVVDANGRVARRFGAVKTPEVFLFDGAGRLVYHGAVDDNANDPEQVEHAYLEEALEAVVRGVPVARPKTKALGCSIKLPRSRT